MKFFKLLLFLFLLFLLNDDAQAQGQNNIWHFGNHASLDFNGGPPVALSGSAIFTNEGCSSISDNAGNLLFYTDGITVWNRLHVMMPNGFGLMGDPSTTQSSMLTPMPGSATNFYVFTIDELGQSMRYSIVDMSLAGGFGDVTATKNVMLHPAVSEKQTAVKRCDGNIWVISHQSTTNTFYADLITTSGIMPSVLSSVGTSHAGGGSGTFNTVGQLKVSQQGNRLALAIRDAAVYEVFDFDINTGIISNPITIGSGSYSVAYGVEFSPDGTKLYGGRITTSLVYQFNLLAGSAAAITASATVVGSTPNFTNSFQLGPDGKIYIAKSISQTVGLGYLDVINNPNALGAACSYVGGGVTLGANLSLLGLPGMMVINAVSLPSVSISGVTSICAGQSTTLTASGGISYNWSGGSVATTDSIVVSPTTTTTYYVSSSTTCGVGYDTVTVVVNPIPVVSVLGTDTICLGTSTTLVASGGTTYQWSGGSTATTPSITVSPVSTTTYSVVACNGTCFSLPASILVQVETLPTVSIAGNDTICFGASTTLTASGGATYLWSGGSTATTASITVSPTTATTYSVVASNSTCSSLQMSISVQVEALPVVSIVGGTPICAGTSATLTGVGGVSYIWSGGVSSTADSINVSPSITTTYYLTGLNSCGSDSDSIIIVVNPLPIASISGDDSICFGEVTNLTASGGLNYQWSGGSSSTSSSIIVAPTSSVIYTVVANNGVCSSLPVSVTVIVNALPNVVITGQDSICQGASTTLLANVSGGTSPYNYLWSTGATLSSATISPTTLSTVIGVNVTDQNGCSDSTSISIMMFPNPIALITGEISGCAPMTALFTNSSSNATSYLWGFGDGNFSTLENPSNFYSDSGSYNVTLIAINAAGCADTITINDYVFLFASPIAGLTAETTTNVDNQSTTINNVSQGGTSCVLYFGDGDSLVGCGWTSVIHNYLAEGVYTVTQIVTNSNGCSDTIQITVIVEFEQTLFFPNAFTPNSNGSNDVFQVYGFGINNFKMMIFNRWGELLFETDDITKGWDGRYKGEPVQQGVYVWKVDYNTKRDGDQFRIGHVTVVR